MKPTLSVVISAYNEEAKIKETLESVTWADEIVFIDNSSTDKTNIIAKKYTRHVFVRVNLPMLNTNKNFGFTKATGEWILNIDADEHISEKLADEIKKVIASDEAVDGYYIPRRNRIFGKWIEHTGWYPDYQLRLFRRGKGKFAEKHVHELIEIDGETAYLTEDLIHYNYESINQFLRKMILLYAPNEAEAQIKSGYTLNAVDVVRFPLREFLSRFFAREGYKDGFHGLVLSLLQAFYHLVVFCFIWEKQKFTDLGVSNSLTLFTGEVNEGSKEMQHWVTEEKIKSSKTLFEKVLLRVRRKVS